MKKLLVAFILLFFVSKVYAFESEYFIVDIPEDYKETIIEDATYKWSKDKKYIAITLGINTIDKHNIKDFTDEDIRNHKDYLEKNITEGLKEYDIVVDVQRIEKIKENDKYYLEYDIYYPSKKLYGYDTYQRSRMFTTNNYITTIIYSSDKPITDEADYKEIFDSLQIKDKEVTKRNYMNSLILMFVLAVIFAIISVIRDNKKKHKE